ncbi:MAG: aldehyde dehydrogenase family protein [Ignavibacteriaceae bacterium]
MQKKESKELFKASWKYSEAPESTGHIKIQKKYDLYIDGKFTKPLRGKYFNTINPANDKKISAVAEATAEDVDLAVKAARKAFNGWSKLSGKDRGKYIFRIARLIQERAREFAVIESMDGGKPIRESRDIDIPLAANHFFYHAGWADKLQYAFPNRKTNPVGVVGQIIPWNFPLLMAAWKLAPALATGNTVVLKPAETTPLTALKLTEVIDASGLPKGVVNVVTGAGQTGASIVNHPDVDKIAFTGSTDAAIDQAVEGIVNAIFFNQGHVCCAGSRLFVQESVADKVIQKLKNRMENLIVGDPLDKNTDIGAVNSKRQLQTIEKYIKIGLNEGGEIYQPDCKLPKKGNWCAPTLFLNVSQSHKIVQEEIFGPVLTIQTFRTIKEVVEKANNTPYGLSAGVWTQNGAKIFHLTQKLAAGVVWANTFNKFDAASPFGGYKESGFGREGGLHGLYPYVKFDQ